MKIISRENYKRSQGQPGGGEMITEQAGYLPPQVQIEQMMEAGRRLADYRKEQFDALYDVDDVELDPTRSPGFDMADASALMMEKKKKLEKFKKRKKVELATFPNHKQLFHLLIAFPLVILCPFAIL